MSSHSESLVQGTLNFEPQLVTQPELPSDPGRLAKFGRFVTRAAMSLALAAGAGAAVGVAGAVFESYPQAAAAAETGGYPDVDAVDCSALYGPYSWCKGNPSYWLSSRGYGYRNCTDWVAWREKQLTNITLPNSLGNGANWDDNAPTYGYSVDNTPEVADIAVWEAPAGYGHVAVVESVNANGTVNVSEYNHDTHGNYGTRNGITADHYIDINGANVTLPPPLMTGDYTGDGKADAVVFTKGTPTAAAKWAARLSPDNTVDYGQMGDIPVPADYTGDNATDIAVFRPTTNPAGWFVRSNPSLNTTYGRPGDIPVPGNYNSGVNGTKAEFAVYRPSNQTWYIRGLDPSIGVFQYGLPGDVPVPADYNGDGVIDPAIYRPSTGEFHVRGMPTKDWQLAPQPGDIPVPGYYASDQLARPAIYRPGSPSTWFVKDLGSTQFGWPMDIPVPGDYANDLHTEAAVYHPGVGGTPAQWNIAVPGMNIDYGWAGDIPAVGTLNAYLLKQYGFISSY